MPYMIMRLFDRLTSRQWRAYLLTVGFGFVIGWLLIYLCEPTGAPIRNPRNYWWYFFISGTSTGYGDLFPVSTGGRIGGLIVILTGVGAGLSLIMQVTLLMEQRRRSRMNGTAQLHDRDHLVVIGYREPQLLELVRQLKADPKCAGMPVVACFFDGQLSGENPHDHLYHVVRWDKSGPQRANLAAAAAIYINAPDDNLSVVTLVDVNARLREAGRDSTHVVIGLNDHDRYQEILGTLGHIRPGTELVQADSMTMVSDAIQNPGVAVIYEALASNLDAGASLYRVDIPKYPGAPAKWGWFELSSRLLILGYTLLAVGDSDSPSASFRLTPGPDVVISCGQSIVVVGEQRPDIRWDHLRTTR